MYIEAEIARNHSFLWGKNTYLYALDGIIMHLFDMAFETS
jgi:hypothetical protein